MTWILYADHQVDPLGRSLTREINPKVMTREEWQLKQCEENTFVTELLSKPKIFVVGAAHDL